MDNKKQEILIIDRNPIIIILICVVLFLIVIQTVAGETIGYKYIQDDSIVMFWNNGSIENETFFRNEGALEQFANKIERFDWANHEFGIAYKISGKWNFLGSSNASGFTKHYYSDNSTQWWASANKIFTMGTSRLWVGVENKQLLNSDYMRRKTIVKANKDVNKEIWFYWRFRNINVDVDDDIDILSSESYGLPINMRLDYENRTAFNNLTNKSIQIGDSDSGNASAIFVFWNDDKKNKLFYVPNNLSNGDVVILKKIGTLQKNVIYDTTYFWIDIPKCTRTCLTSVPPGGCGFFGIVPSVIWRYNHTVSGQIMHDGIAGNTTKVSWRVRVFDFIMGRVCTNCSYNSGCHIQFKTNDTNGSLPLLKWKPIPSTLINNVWRTCTDTSYSLCRDRAQSPQYEDYNFDDDYTDTNITCHRPRVHWTQADAVLGTSSGGSTIRQNCTDSESPIVTNIFPLNNTYLGGTLQQVNLNCSVQDDGTLGNISMWYTLEDYGINIKRKEILVINKTIASLNASVWSSVNLNYSYHCNATDFIKNPVEGVKWYYFNLPAPTIIPAERLPIIFYYHPLRKNDEDDFILALMKFFIMFGIA